LSKAAGVPDKTADGSRQIRRLAQKGWRAGHVVMEIVSQYCKPSTQQLSMQKISQVPRG
jgi:hypothetical protein